MNNVSDDKLIMTPTIICHPFAFENKHTQSDVATLTSNSFAKLSLKRNYN